MAKEKQFNVRISVDGADRLEKMAEHYALNVPAFLRMIAKREWDRLELRRELARELL